jgi:arsenate reductase
MGRQTELYGIRNCDTVKKARAWLEVRDIAYVFHDFKTEGVDPGMLAAWVQELGWESLLNRAGTTFRGLPEASKQDLDAGKAVALMAGQPSMIKRPVLVVGGRLLVGFKTAAYEAVFSSPAC